MHFLDTMCGNPVPFLKHARGEPNMVRCRACPVENTSNRFAKTHSLKVLRAYVRICIVQNLHIAKTVMWQASLRGAQSELKHIAKITISQSDQNVDQVIHYKLKDQKPDIQRTINQKWATCKPCEQYENHFHCWQTGTHVAVAGARTWTCLCKTNLKQHTHLVQ